MIWAMVQETRRLDALGSPSSYMSAGSALWENTHHAVPGRMQAHLSAR